MGVFSKLKQLLGFKKKKDKVHLKITCSHCGQQFDSVFRRNYDFQPAYGEEEYDYSINKELVCPGCYRSLQLNLELNKSLEISTQNLNNGELEIVPLADED
jgi:hypothetical protein